MSRPTTFASAIQSAARALMVARTPDKRELGRALLACEPLALYKSKKERTKGRQDLIGRVGAANDEDRRRLEEKEKLVAAALSQALGLWHGAITLMVDPMDPAKWVHASNPVTALADRRLDRYLDDAIQSSPTGVRRTALVEHAATARMILRRLRYRTSYDWGNQTDTPPTLQVWTTPVGARWCALFTKHTPSGAAIRYLPHYLLEANSTLPSLSVDHCTMDPNDWGDVDPEHDPIRVLQLTTPKGSTESDVRAILDRAGQQVSLTTRHTGRSDRDRPLSAFNAALAQLADDEVLSETDVLLVHRGGGVTTEGSSANVSKAEREAMRDALRTIQGQGVEVVVAIGHADARIFEPEQHKKVVGFFEATTPTAGAAWILQEHINSRLVDDEDVYSQP